MTDPTTVTGAQVRAAYDALGLDPERWDDVLTLDIDIYAHQLRVRRMGVPYTTQSLEIPIDWNAPTCTCPDVDVSTPTDPCATVKGWDHDCPEHGCRLHHKRGAAA